MSTLPELPHIPLEVAENIIDQLGGHIHSLRKCALTCRGWNRHARCHLVAAIRVRSREDLYSICDYFTSNPRMASLVRTLSMSPAEIKNCRFLLEIIPVDLLKRLPNLQRYSILGGGSLHCPSAFFHDPTILIIKTTSVSFHDSTLLHIKTYLHVEELNLNSLKFRTSVQLARVLMALPRLRRLETGSDLMEIKTTDTSRYRDKCKMLTEVTVMEHTVACLIVQMSLSTLRVVRCGLSALKDEHSTVDLSELKHLHSLEFLVYDPIEDSFDRIVPLIGTMPSNKLRSLTISFSSTRNWRTISDHVGHPLEDAILALGIPSLVVSVAEVKRNRPVSKIVQRYFPRLHEGKLLQVQCSSGYTDGEFHLGHETRVEAMDASLDGRYFATGAHDGTVIVWSGTTAPERTLVEMQCPAESQGVRSLHFSDTGDFLAGICDHSLLIWRVVDGVQVTSMPEPLWCERSCAWRSQSLDHLTLSVMEWGIHDDDEEPRSAYLSVTEVHVLHSGTVTTSDPVSLLPDHFPDIYEGLFEHRTRITHSSSGSCVAAWNISELGCCIWKMPVGDSTPAYTLTHRLSYGHPHSSPWWAIFVGDTQLVIGFDDGTIRWWDISSFPSTQLEPCGIRALLPQSSSGDRPPSVSPQHSFLIAWGWEDKSVPILRRTKTPTSQGSLAPPDNFSLHVTLHGHMESVTAVCFSPCERYVATASEDGTVRLWSTSDGELLWTFHGNDLDTSELVTHVSFSLDGRRLATASNGGRVRVRLLAMFVRDVPVPSVDDT